MAVSFLGLPPPSSREQRWLPKLPHVEFSRILSRNLSCSASAECRSKSPQSKGGSA